MIFVRLFGTLLFFLFFFKFERLLYFTRKKVIRYHFTARYVTCPIKLQLFLTPAKRKKFKFRIVYT